MRVLKPLTMARRRQMCAGPARRTPHEGLYLALPTETADVFDMREESRAFTDTSCETAPREAAE